MPPHQATAPDTQADAPALFRELVAARLLSESEAATALAQFEAAELHPNAHGLAEFLVQAGLLTDHQAGRALAGQSARLVLGPYLLQEPIGNGSLGTVYRALHRDSRRRFAVKVLPLRSLWNVLQAKGQVREFAALAAHPAVVPFVDIDTAAGSHYLAWPFVEGETLDRVVGRVGPLPPGEAVTLLAEVADGLAACHARGIVHGLLKPSNLMVGPDRRAKILDLGIGAILSANLAEDESLLDTISTASTAMGMIDCAAPETMNDPTDRTRAGDLYSLGCVLYFLASGRYPFPDGNAVDKMIAHQRQEPTPLDRVNPAVPAALADLAAQLMRKAPADRPRDAAAVREALLAAVPATASAAMLGRSTRRAVTVTPAPWPTEAAAETPTAPRPHDTPTPDDQISFEITHSLLAQDAPWSSGRAPNAPGPRRAAPKPTEAVIPLVKPASPRPTPLPPPAQINWAHAASTTAAVTLGVTPPRPPRPDRSWRRAARKLLFWLPPCDTVQLSLFGPTGLTPGQTYRFQVYAHPPQTFASVRTLSRAFQPDTELRGSGFVGQPVTRGHEIGLHLALSHAGIAKSLVRFAWAGQTRPWAFEVYVPWESPAGPTGGVLTVGLNNREAVTIPFEVLILPRSG